MSTPTTRVELPDGDWAELRNPKKVPERLRRPVRVAALNLQRSLPEEQRRGIVKLANEPSQVAEGDVQGAFGAPPVDQLAEENAASDEDALAFLPDGDQSAFVDDYNEALILSVVVAWSFGDVTA